MRDQLQRLRSRAGAIAINGFFRGLSGAGRLHPLANPARHQVGVQHDVPYVDSGRHEHRLDVYTPRATPGPHPVVLYIHGGGFRILSKDTHWLMGLAFARRGYLVFNIGYRLAPEHPYPAAVADACAAYEWVVKNAARFGGDISRLVVAGESAGANLATAMAISACYRREEPHARAVFETGVVPRAVLPACGILQVSDTERFARRKKLPGFIRDRLHEVERGYLRGWKDAKPGDLDLADPLLVLERGEAPARPLPPFFAPVGTADPLLDDTRRLAVAIERLGGVCEARYYPGEVHAFHALVMRKAARECWGHTFEFLDKHLNRPATEAAVAG